MPEPSVAEVQKPEAQPTAEPRYPGKALTLEENWKNLVSHNEARAAQRKEQQAKSWSAVAAKEGKEPVRQESREPRTAEESWQRFKSEIEEKQGPTETSESRPEASADTKADTKPAAATEPKPDDRAWTTRLEGREREAHVQKVEHAAATAMDHVTQHAQRQQIEVGLRNAWAGRQAQYADFVQALSEVSNPGEVLAQLGLNKSDRDILLSARNWAETRLFVQHISKALLPKLKPAEPKPRAPRPPAEVGGRGTASVDDEAEALRSNDFARAEAVWNRRAFRKER